MTNEEWLKKNAEWRKIERRARRQGNIRMLKDAIVFWPLILGAISGIALNVFLLCPLCLFLLIFYVMKTE